MQKVKFCDCVDIVGKAPKNFSGEKIYVSTGALDKNYIDFSQIEKINFASRPSRANLEVKADNIIFAKMYQTDKTLLIDEEKENYIYSTGFFAIRPKQQKITTKCLMYLIQSDEFIKQKDKYCSGATQKAITNEGLKKIEINIPPIEDQKVIAERLDKLSELIEKRKEQIKKLDLLIKSRFLEMFGTNDNEYRFSDCVLGDKIILLSDFSANGSYEKLDSNVKMYDQPNYAWMVRTTDLESQDIFNIKYIDKNSYNLLSKSRLYGNELIMCKIGSAGKMYLMPKIDKPASLGRNAFLMRFNEQDVNMIYLFTYLNTTPLQKEIQKRVKGAVTKTITKDDVRSIPLILPPIELQNQFAAFVEKTDKVKQTIKINLDKLETLKKSLMQQYFG